MKRFLLWVVGVILGVAVLLGAVMTVSYSFTGEGSRPAADTQFGGQALEVNGSCWQVPLLGGVFDKVFTSPETLTVQKLGVLYDAHPALALPDWASYTTMTIETDIGSIVFAGSASQYEDFLFPANGDYKAKLTVWRLPQDYLATQFEGGSTGAIRKNLGVEHPAKPTGWYSYSFRFTLQASAEVALSTERLEQGGVAALSITGLTGETAPAVETDLGSVQCVRLGSGWRAYIPAAYNASAGGHTVNVTVNGETFARTLTVLPKDFGTVEVEPEPASTEAANTEFRNNIWPLYEQPVREKLWAGAFLCPAENYMTLVDFGQVKVTGGQQGSRSNSTRLYTIPGEPCRAPAEWRGGLCGRSGPHRQHRGHRPRLRRAQLSVWPAGALRDPRPDRGAGAGCRRAGRGADHGLQARQQEREPLAPVPDQRWVILAGEGLILQKICRNL